MEQQVVKLTDAENQLADLLKAAGANDASNALSAHGLPHRRIEEYHYTDLRTLLRDVPSDLAQANDRLPDVQFEGYGRIVIVNGKLVHADEIGGVEIKSADAAAKSVGNDQIINLMDGLAQNQIEITINTSLDKPIHIAHVHDGPDSVVADKVRVTTAEGVHATIVETFEGANARGLRFANFALDVAADAEMLHVQLDQNAEGARQFVQNTYDLHENANLRTLASHANFKLGRTDIKADFKGEGAHADFAGLTLLMDQQHGDFTLNVNHGVPNTTSTETFKSIVRDRAKAIFQGKIIVAPDAQKTDAQMMSQGLLLSERAEVLVKPELEIFADDVLCAHGATCGELDEDALFYLMSRGIKRAEAESMLIRAFLAELFDEMENEQVRDKLGDRVDAWLAAAE
ncbi:Fe-S cluster assembly protein SufD [Maritalea mediterranea]|uniref:Fe-S cluster assembly protein SufD n=1 Tax=Maritalea mediterranea TaxID=2909667 RepID=A0ABS9EAF5_9HYPH|nr:Fe-S cluster assembly protein SufD [Maritalea mediterranea]MCF4099827.1 Fe-S cluster assembly protein SufD [Maritalea mediterranea]